MQVKTEDGQIKDVNILDVTPENFIVPKGEEDCYHCRIEVKKFNQDTGVRISKPRMQVFGKKFFESFGLHNLRKQGFTVDVMHDPNKWLQENEAKLEAEKQKKAEAEAKAKAEAAEAEKKAMKEAMKAEILAELKAEELLATAAKPGRKPKETPEAKQDAPEVKPDAPETNE
jgi:hypothetical protein|nr:MAG TPA: hypothetical protein [Caudoviricetes sp.]